MIRHIVMWNVRGASLAEKAAGVALLQRSFHSLRGATRLALCLCSPLKTCMTLRIRLTTGIASLEAYATHPEHLRVKQEIGDLRIARHQVDYRVE